MLAPGVPRASATSAIQLAASPAAETVAPSHTRRNAAKLAMVTRAMLGSPLSFWLRGKCAHLARYCDGDIPHARLNATWNLATDPKPLAKQTSVTVSSPAASRSAACATRRSSR